MRKSRKSNIFFCGVISYFVIDFFAALIGKLGGSNVVDLLWQLPRDLIDRSRSPSIAAAPVGTIATLLLTVDRHFPGHGKRPYRVRCTDEGGFLALIFFHARKDYLEKALPMGEKRIVSGTLEVGSERAFAWMSKMVQRNGTAIEDLDCLSLL